MRSPRALRDGQRGHLQPSCCTAQPPAAWGRAASRGTGMRCHGGHAESWLEGVGCGPGLPCREHPARLQHAPRCCPWSHCTASSPAQGARCRSPRERPVRPARDRAHPARRSPLGTGGRERQLRAGPGRTGPGWSRRHGAEPRWPGRAGPGWSGSSRGGGAAQLGGRTIPLSARRHGNPPARRGRSSGPVNPRRYRRPAR